MYWSPIIIYNTVDALVMIIIYDSLRYLIPKDTHKTFGYKNTFIK